MSVIKLSSITRSRSSIGLLTVEAEQTARIQGVGPAADEKTDARADAIEDWANDKQRCSSSRRKQSHLSICSNSLIDLSRSS